MFEYEKPVAEIIELNALEAVMSLSGSDGGNEDWDGDGVEDWD